MSEEKSALNSYTMVLAFMLIAILFMLHMLQQSTPVAPGASGPGSFYGILIVDAALIACGIVIIRAGKNSMTGTMFCAYGAIEFIASLAVVMYTPEVGQPPSSSRMYLLGLFFIVLSLIELLSSNKNRYALTSIMLLSAAVYFSGLMGRGDYARMILPIIEILLIVLAIYFAFALVSERFALPFSESLKAEEITDFKKCGSMIGYIIIALLMAVDVLFDVSGLLALGEVVCFKIVGSITLLVVAVLLRSSGQMKYTPILFAMIGIIMLLGGTEANAFIGGVFTRNANAFYVLGTCMIIAGVFTLLRKDSRILMAILCFAIGACYITYGPGNLDLVGGVLAAISMIVALYLAFAVSVDRIKLPLI